MTLRDFFRGAAIPLALGFVAVFPLLRGLELEGFYSGDSGVKLVAAQQAAAHPARPFTIDMPEIGGEPAGEFMEPFFRVHGDHVHAVMPPLFPVLTAPFLAWLGVPGVYVWPVTSLLLLIPLAAALARRLGLAGPPALYGLAVLVTSPLLFYGLEYWEHAPAAAAVCGAAALALRRRARPGGVAWAGLLCALAIQLRPEAFWSTVALWLSLGAMGAGPRSMGLFAAATLAGLLPQGVYNAVHFGTPLGLHLGSALGEAPESLVTRLGFARLWLFSWRPESLWPAMPFGLLALVMPRVDRAGLALWLLVLVPILGIVATTPNDGGAQWAPRYLLCVVPPLLLLAVDAGLRLRERAGTGVAGWLVTAGLVAAMATGVMSTRAAYRTLHGTKRPHARIARTTAALAERYVVSNAWWFDQFAAAAAPTHTFLFAKDETALAEIARRLDRANVRRFVVVQSGMGPVWDVAAVMGDTRYRTVKVARQRERKLEFRTFEAGR
jgi:hypothetical protein